MIKLAILLILSILSAILYRLGGIGKPFNTRYRDIGCGVLTLATCLYLGLTSGFWLTVGAYLLVFGLSWGALASYWGLDEQKWGFWAHGLGLSLALLPIAYITGHWFGFGLRCLILTAFITIWSQIISWDDLEEGGRGFAIIATLPLLLL